MRQDREVDYFTTDFNDKNLIQIYMAGQQKSSKLRNNKKKAQTSAKRMQL
jgi:hypothetical protein